ncbi:hypothetical protein AORI_5846 [Amycolatopsis keratiniphila]|uniref:Uncharacterized protein n=1 Tax=Amycolatopsis keratiniphila TaxID=129921 RepID=R4SYN6_9PSEU|nr:hypothetical protein AORI_5846 [Amycolatopsis keratiniphila]
MLAHWWVLLDQGCPTGRASWLRAQPRGASGWGRPRPRTVISTRHLPVASTGSLPDRGRSSPTPSGHATDLILVRVSGTSGRCAGGGFA